MKFKPYIIGIIIALLLEVTVFNFSSLRSIGNTPVDLTSKATVETLSDSGVIYHIDDVGVKVNNLGFTFASNDELIVDYTISLSDEGNSYSYELPTGTVSWKSPESFYTNVYSYGAVRTMDIQFESAGGQSDSQWGGQPGNQLDGQPSSQLNGRLIGIYANVKRPTIFNLMRFLIVSIIISFFIALREGSFLDRSVMTVRRTLNITADSPDKVNSIGKSGKAVKNPNGKNSKENNKVVKNEAGYLPEHWQLYVTVLVMVLWIALGFFWSNSHADFNEASKPHHQQYKELARALESGSVALPYEPSEGLLNAPNPYDTIYLQANDIEYMADYAYFNGKYYVYFGIVPELMFYLPYHLITGNDLANHYVVFAYYALFVVGVFLLFREIALRYFKNLKFFAYILVSSFIATSGTFAYVFSTADIYSVPIMAGLGLTVAGLWLWMLGARLCAATPGVTATSSTSVNGMVTKHAAIKFFASLTLGSLCMALVAGCRPQMLLFSLLIIPILIIPIFAKNIFKPQELSQMRKTGENSSDAHLTGIKGTTTSKPYKKLIGSALCIIVPYALVAAVVMWYNYARFGSVFDFGATYSLTNNDMNLRGVNLPRMILGLMTFLFQMPNVTGEFPFIQSATLSFDYMGKMVTEYFFGGVLTINVLTWVLAFYGKYHWCIKAKGLRLFMGLSLGSALIIGLVDANTAGILQRYSADLAFGIFLAVGVLLLILVEQSPKTGMTFLKVGFWVELAVSLFIICNRASGISLEIYNRELYITILNFFRF